MARARRRLALGLALLTLPLPGCDLAAASFFAGPALLPGVGKPVTGRVLDSLTLLPVGGATVVSGVGSTTSDGDGRFRLYGNLGSHAISVARAGYTALTMGGLDPGEPQELDLDPLYPEDATLEVRFANLKGRLTTQRDNGPVASGLLSFAGVTASVARGDYHLEYRAETPGRLLTGVLAGGAVEGTVDNPASAVPPPFHFLDFGYRFVTMPLADKIAGSDQQADLASGGVPLREIRVAYTNVGALSNVQTDVTLDFGITGSVPVARGFGSTQTLSVPAIPELKYVVLGQAADSLDESKKRKVSTVSITTNDPSQAAFQLLGVPTNLAPADGAKSADPNPTFSWDPVPGATGYEITLYEVVEKTVTRPKWVARTFETSVAYPRFSLGDINNGALRPDQKYAWSLKAVDLLDPEEIPQGAGAGTSGGGRPKAFRALSPSSASSPFPAAVVGAGGFPAATLGAGAFPASTLSTFGAGRVGALERPPLRPFRVRKRESEARGYTFSF